MLSKEAILEIHSNLDTESSENRTPNRNPKKPYVPEGSQKRCLSSGSTPSPTTIHQEDKRHRTDIGEFDWNSTQVNRDNREPEVTLADLMDQLKLTAKVSDLVDLAKKEDLIKLQDTVTTNSMEIQQLRDDLAIQTPRIQQLEVNLGNQAASMLNRTQPDVYSGQQSQHGGAHQTELKQDSRRKNLVIEGITNGTDRDTIEFILQICSTLDIIAFACDIESVIRMKRRDESTRPMPALVTFDQLHVPSAILRKKAALIDNEKFAMVFINLPLEVRRAKSVLRRVGYSARQDGREV